MTYLRTRTNKEDHPDLLTLLKAHPEIQYAALIYRRQGRTSKVATDYGVVAEYSYDVIDWEYSYVGEADDDLLDFASKCDLWDDLQELTLDAENVLKGRIVNDDYEQDADTFPDCSLTPRSLTSADCIELEAMTLPSGKRIEFRS